jgi:hypothetical protein
VVQRRCPQSANDVRFGSMLSKKASISTVMSLDALLMIAASGVWRH